MIVTGEGSLVGLLMGITLGYPLEYPNCGAELSVTLPDAPLGLWFGSCAVWG